MYNTISVVGVIGASGGKGHQKDHVVVRMKVRRSSRLRGASAADLSGSIYQAANVTMTKRRRTLVHQRLSVDESPLSSPEGVSPVLSTRNKIP
jgi:hypothetical protein